MPGEIALLRWLLAKPRPVTIGPIGNCVKRGWCEPVRSVIEDHDGRKLAFVYVVTEAGSLLLREHETERAKATQANPVLIDTLSNTTEHRRDRLSSEGKT